MRRIKQSKEGRWYAVVEESGGVSRLDPVAWGQDPQGIWPRVDLEVRSIGETVACPRCGCTWAFEEMDCVFGRSRRSGNDVLMLVRCTTCRQPHRVRAVGLITAYPRVVELMEGWSDWERRRTEFDAEETRLFGGDPSRGPVSDPH